MTIEMLDKAVRRVPDFPKPGILFYDITGVLVNPEALKFCIDQMIEKYKDVKFDAVAGVESRILQDTKDTASVSDELNSTQTNFANTQLGQYHKLAERYGSLLKYRSLIPEQYHNPVAMSELVKIVTTMGADSWGEALELCDIKMMSHEGIPLSNDLYQQISRYFHNDKCVMHMISICENDAKMEALAETWKNNQRVNAEYLNYEKTLQAQTARSDA